MKPPTYEEYRNATGPATKLACAVLAVHSIGQYGPWPNDAVLIDAHPDEHEYASLRRLAEAVLKHAR